MVFGENVAAGRSFAGDKRRFGPNGTIYIANDLTDISDPATGKRVITAFEVSQRAYVHELGNLLSRRISSDGSPYTFGNEEGISGVFVREPDFDTGAALEKCVFGEVIP